MILGASLTLTLMLLFSMFIIDFRRMSKNQPVVFSTWGFKYHPVVNLDEEMIDIAIKNYLIEKSDNELIYHNNQKAFVSMRVYLRDYSKTQINIYAWVLEEIYYLENGKIQKDSASSIPYKFVIDKVDGNYLVVNSRIPRDGSYYSDDMKNIFPSSVRKDMESVHYDGTIDKLKLDIQEQTKLYFH